MRELAKLQTKLRLGPGVLALNRPQDAPESAPANVVPLQPWAPPHGIPDDGMNKTERRYLMWLRCFKDKWIAVHSITLKLAHDCRLTMDFAVVDESGLRLIDTKAFNRKTRKPHIEDDALVKMRVAADRYPWIRFVIAWEDETGAWQHKDVVPLKE